MAYTFVYAALGLVGFLITAKRIWDRPTYHFIPTVGPSGRLSSYAGGLRFITSAREILKHGYYRYPFAMFKVPTIDKWEIIVNGPQLIDDMRRARDDELSFHHASSDNTQLRYTTKSGIQENSYHLKIVQTTLTTHFGAFCSDIHDETVQSLAALIPPKSREWVSFQALTSMTEVIARTSNRVFVGLPLCRDPDYIALSIDFTSNIVKAAGFISLAPRILQPFVGLLVSPFHRNKRMGLKHLGPIINERLRKKAEYGKEWEEKPNDLISWLIDEAEGDQLQAENLVMRILFLNFAAIHTTSITLTHALFDLAVHPEYVQPLRDEVEAIIQEEGWTKSAVGRMYKLDSFLRESMRYNGLAGISMMRKVVSPEGFTFSNGVKLPYGTFLSAAADALHHDEATYSGANTFNGYRFFEMAEDDEDRVKYQFTSPSLQYIPFGIGRHACPGRFFAAHEIKSTLAYVLLTYDIKVKDDVRPENQWFAYACVPNTQAEIMFRNRQA